MPHTSTGSGRARLSTALLVALGMAGCAGREPRPIEFETGSREEVTAEGLHRVANPRFRSAWARPGADFSRYEAIQLVLVELRYKGKPTARRAEQTSRSDFALSDAQREQFESLFREVFAAELEASPYYEVVEQPGPGVLRAEASIIDLVVKVPTEIRSNERTFTRSTAAMNLLLELFDSSSDEILARLSDRRDALAAGHGGQGSVEDLYLSNPASDTGALRLTFRRWAKTLRHRLDEAHELAAARH